MDVAISVENLVHTFNERRAVDGLSLTVRKGEVFGLLGPNGAGKTTTVRLLNGLYAPASGSLRVMGLNPVTQGKEVRMRTGVLTETPALYERLTARQNLEFFGTLAGMSNDDLQRSAAEMLSFFGLENRAGDKVGSYSKGMKQRLALARALLTHPQIIFLDEPTSGLDPESAQQVHELIQSLRKRDGHTVFLCTHHLDEAERLCDRVGILNRGRLLAQGTLEDLRLRIVPDMWVEVDLLQPLQGVLPELTELPGVLQLQIDALKIRARVEGQAVVPGLVTRLVQTGAQVVRVQPREVSLEDIYFKLQNDQKAEGL